MKTKILSGSTLAAAAIALALSGVAATPAAAKHQHACAMEKGKGGKTKCMTKGGHCIHHMKSHCSTRHRCKAKHSGKK